MASISILAIVVWVLVACNKQNFKELASMPYLEPSEQQVKRNDIGLYFAQQKTFNWVDTKVPTDIKVTLFDVNYKAVDYYFFLKFYEFLFVYMRFFHQVFLLDIKYLYFF